MKLRVLRDKGLPIDAPIHAFDEIVETDDALAETWIERGYAEAIQTRVPQVPQPTAPSPRIAVAESDLLGAGYSQAEIDAMSPQQAAEALKKK
jgi:hypothetical protein